MTNAIGAALLFLAMVPAMGLSAHAQTPSSPLTSDSGAAGASGPPGPFGGMNPADAELREASVLLVTSVEIIHSSHDPALDLIRVRGLTTTEGWTEPSLKPLTAGTPPDGVLDLVFVAEAPPAASQPMGFSPIAIIFPIQPGHPYKGVRVHGEYNSVTVNAIPGFAETRTTLNDCHDCIGKYFIAAGAQAPANATAENVVRQENLPKTLRVVRPSDGVTIIYSDPNRLTLIIADDGKILDVGWD